jgi:hypothetical protein
MHVVGAYEANISGDIRLTALKKTKFKDFDTINGKTSFIFREI